MIVLLSLHLNNIGYMWPTTVLKSLKADPDNKFTICRCKELYNSRHTKEKQ